MPDHARDDDAALARTRAQARRAAHGLVIVVAVLFIGASTAQIVSAVFALGTVPASEPGPCALGVKRLAQALDRGCATAGEDHRASEPGVIAPASHPDAPPLAPCEERRVGSEADAVARVCAETPGGLDAWAALERMRLAQEELARRDRTDLAPLMRDVSAHLPAQLR